jgi:hypothetical protein
LGFAVKDSGMVQLGPLEKEQSNQSFREGSNLVVGLLTTLSHYYKILHKYINNIFVNIFSSILNDKDKDE